MSQTSDDGGSIDDGSGTNTDDSGSEERSDDGDFEYSGGADRQLCGVSMLQIAHRAGPFTGDGTYDVHNTRCRIQSFADGSVAVYDRTNTAIGSGTLQPAADSVAPFDRPASVTTASIVLGTGNGQLQAYAPAAGAQLVWEDGDVWNPALGVGAAIEPDYDSDVDDGRSTGSSEANTDWSEDDTLTIETEANMAAGVIVDDCSGSGSEADYRTESSDGTTSSGSESPGSDISDTGQTIGQVEMDDIADTRSQCTADGYAGRAAHGAVARARQRAVAQRAAAMLVDRAIGDHDTASDDADHETTSGSDESYVSLPSTNSPDEQPQPTTDTDGESSRGGAGAIGYASADDGGGWAGMHPHLVRCPLCDTTIGAGSMSLHLAFKHSETTAAPGSAQ